MKNNYIKKHEQEIRKVFEPRYGRQLSDIEVVEIGSSLADFVELLIVSRTNRRSAYVRQ